MERIYKAVAATIAAPVSAWLAAMLGGVTVEASTLEAVIAAALTAVGAGAITYFAPANKPGPRVTAPGSGS